MARTNAGKRLHLPERNERMDLGKLLFDVEEDNRNRIPKGEHEIMAGSDRRMQRHAGARSPSLLLHP